MISSEHLVHERTLLGAIDSYLSELVHTRPFLAADQRETLEIFADWWLNEQSGANDIGAIGSTHLRDFQPHIEHSGVAMIALRMFFDWAKREGLRSE